jgi:hypothetical protein
VRQLDEGIGDTFVWAIPSSNCAVRFVLAEWRQPDTTGRFVSCADRSLKRRLSNGVNYRLRDPHDRY